MANNAGKLAVVCRFMPPQVGGSAVLLSNLLRHYRGELVAIAGWEPEAKVDTSFQPPWVTYNLRFHPHVVERAVNHYERLHFAFVKRFVYRKLRVLRPAAVLAAYPDALFFIAAFQACRRLGIPFWGHMHDLWSENATPGSYIAALAARWEETIFREADRLFCMTESQVENYQHKYPRRYELLPHCIPGDAAIPDTIPVRTPTPQQGYDVLYTGNISSWMNLSAIRNFIGHVDHLSGDVRITMLTSMDTQTLQKIGAYHPRIAYDWVTVAEARRRVCRADVLFLPLSFRDCAADEVRTVFSTKSLDYLVSGVPVLVYAPADSYHARSARERGWAHVVDQESGEALCAGLEQLLHDTSLRQRVVDGALAEARRRHPAQWISCLDCGHVTAGVTEGLNS
jgi:glycosyltransferase involved in cell wall biosynthesis